MQPIKVVICEDHNLAIDGLRVILSMHPKYAVVGHAHNQAELEPLLRETKPDILLMDINLGAENGLDLAKNARQDFPALRILMLTMYSDRELIDKAKEIKANGYLTKDARSSDLIAALEGIMGDSFYENPEAVANHTTRTIKRDEFIEKMKLTPREVEIIALVGKGKDAEAISEMLFLSVHTVRTHKKNMMKKLGLKSVAEMVRYAKDNHLS
jgi:DNA-binding NarL/FixJ family response regulator